MIDYIATENNNGVENSLKSEWIGWRWAAGLDAVHGMPLVETRAVRVHVALIERTPRVRRAAREVVHLPGLCTRTMESL